jgi:preprotein translocase subunit SecD
LSYGDLKDKVNTAENQQISTNIEQIQVQINALELNNRQIREQYDSTLLEQIAGQPRDRSINLVGAEKAKQEFR